MIKPAPILAFAIVGSRSVREEVDRNLKQKERLLHMAEEEGSDALGTSDFADRSIIDIGVVSERVRNTEGCCRLPHGQRRKHNVNTNFLGRIPGGENPWQRTLFPDSKNIW